MEHSLGPLLHHVWAGSGHPSVQPEPLLPTGDPAPPVPARALPARREPPPPEQRLLEQLGWRRPPAGATALPMPVASMSPACVHPAGPGGRGQSQAAWCSWTLKFSQGACPGPFLSQPGGCHACLALLVGAGCPRPHDLTGRNLAPFLSSFPGRAWDRLPSSWCRPFRWGKFHRCSEIPTSFSGALQNCP